VVRELSLRVRGPHDLRNGVREILVLARAPLLQLVELTLAAEAERLVLGAHDRVLPRELDERGYLRAKDVRIIWLEEIVDCADVVAASDVARVLADRGEEDDRHVARARPPAKERGGLETVHLRHLHVEQDDGELHLQRVLQRLDPGRRADDVHVLERLEDRLQRQEVRRLVVDDEDIANRRADRRRTSTLFDALRHDWLLRKSSPAIAASGTT